MSVSEALRIYTENGARALRLEDRIGSLEVGKSAGFIVLDRNPLRVKPEVIAATRLRETWFEGKRVFQDDEAHSGTESRGDRYE